MNPLDKFSAWMTQRRRTAMRLRHIENVSALLSSMPQVSKRYPGTKSGPLVAVIAELEQLGHFENHREQLDTQEVLGITAASRGARIWAGTDSEPDGSVVRRYLMVNRIGEALFEHYLYSDPSDS